MVSYSKAMLAKTFPLRGGIPSVSPGGYPSRPNSIKFSGLMSCVNYSKRPNIPASDGDV